MKLETKKINFVIVDTRESPDYNESHVITARYAPRVRSNNNNIFITFQIIFHNLFQASRNLALIFFRMTLAHSQFPVMLNWKQNNMLWFMTIQPVHLKIKVSLQFIFCSFNSVCLAIINNLFFFF